MAKKKVTQIAEELLADFLEQEGYELYHSEFVKEGSDWFLRVYIDLKQEAAGADTDAAGTDTDAAGAGTDAAGADTDAGSEDSSQRYISTEDCEKVSRFLSEAMDQADPIEQNYYLEVSSPGMDRPLLKPEHWRRYIGHQVEVRLYRGKDGTKNISGRLDRFTEGAEDDPLVAITDENGKLWELALSEIAKARLAVVF